MAMLLKTLIKVLSLSLLFTVVCGLGMNDVRAKFDYVPDSLFTIDRNLTNSERRKLRHRRILFVYVESGASKDLFSTPKLFPNVRQVQLLSNEFLNEHLALLSDNYSGLENLYIDAETPLSDTALGYLRRFKRLKILTLKSPIHNPALLQQSIPKNIYWLAISDSTWTLPRLSKLKRLDVWDCRVSASFFESLHAPRLKKLVLTNTFVEKGALKIAATCFPKLKSLDLSAAHLEDLSEVDVLRRTTNIKQISL